MPSVAFFIVTVYTCKIFVKLASDEQIFFLVAFPHRHLRNIDCIMARTACLVCFISTVNGRSKKKKEKNPIMSGASSGHTTKLKQSILLRCLCISQMRSSR